MEIVLTVVSLVLFALCVALGVRLLRADKIARAEADERLAALADLLGQTRAEYETRYQTLFDRLAARELPEVVKAQTYEMRVGLAHERKLHEIDVLGARPQEARPAASEGVVVGLGLSADTEI